MDYDMKPTDSIAGAHLVGTVEQRFLLTYPVPPAALGPFVPHGCVLETFGGKGWVSACAVRISGLRASFAPKATGIGVDYLIIRTVARLPFPDGAMRRSVLMLEANLSSRLAGALAGRVTGIASHVRPITLAEREDGWHIELKERDGAIRFAAVVPHVGISDSLPPGSAFPDPVEASRFILDMSFGGEWLRRRDAIRLLAETHDPCELQFGRSTTRANAFVHRLAGGAVEADNVLVMSGVPHQFALRGILSRLPEPPWARATASPS